MNSLENRVVFLSRLEFQNEVLTAFMQKNYPGVIQLLNGNDQHLSLSPLKRSLLGLSLCLLRQYSPGLRELSLALELSPYEDVGDRIISLLYLYVGLETASQPLLANKVYKQMLKEDRFGLLKAFESMSIDEEPMLSMNVPKLAMVTNTLKSQLFNNYSMVYINISRFKKVYAANNLEKSMLYLRELFDIVISLSPLEHFDKFRYILPSVREIEQISEFHYNKLIIDPVQRKIQYLNSLRNIIVPKTLLAFLSLQSQNYEDSYYKFAWILRQMVKLAENYTESELDEYGLTKMAFKSVSLLLSKALVNTPNELKRKINVHESLNQIIGFADLTKTVPHYNQFYFDYFFTMVGLLYLEKSFVNSFEIAENSFILSKPDLEESIRKMIIVSSLKAVDDLSIVKVYRLILSGLILLGGVDFKIIWFFNFLKSFFQIQSSVNDQITLQHYLSPLAEEVIMATSFCLSEMIEFEGNFRRNSRDGKISECPQVQINTTEDKRSITVEPYRGVKTHGISEGMKVKKSQKFLHLWVRSYRDYKGEIPIGIQTYIEYLYNSMTE